MSTTEPARSRPYPAFVAPGLLCLMLAACTAVKSPPVPVEERAGRDAVPATAPGEPAPAVPPVPAPYPESGPDAPLPAPPDRPHTAPAPRTPAVMALLEREAAATRAGNTAQAAAELERALRIAPADRELWLRLARVRLQQRLWLQAESTALKCLSMGGDAAVTRSAWDVVASARSARGDATGAEAARQRAASLPGP